ncbi:MAG TPA: class I tRNA ligase family protein [Ferruginibacter sp.]|jgi:leucyl-tRNA synthetase|nr:class I tRNA ligase family protein [Ferruginibacter sp.]
MEYDFRKIEQGWQQKWKDTDAYKVSNNSAKPKYYVLDMFPYPSGAGLHVGHPLGYIASDIYSRYKRLKGYNVLHPMGYDSFGLPAEQYALETGQHPAITTEKNIATFRSQLDKIGFCYDWGRQVRTSDADYYKWTQWIFLQIFESWYDHAAKKATPIAELIELFEAKGNADDRLLNSDHHFTAAEWKTFSEKQQQEIIMDYRLAFSAYGEVNWCEALGTVLANDEVVNGVSERGGYPVVKKKMRQWYLRITEYADRLLEGLERIEFSDAMKEMQKNWIGKSQGAEIDFEVKSEKTNPKSLKVYTTRPDTIFGVDFMVIAPEHELVAQITTADQKAEIDKYLDYVKSRSERERMSEVKQITGCFTGAYAINPFDGKEIPIWIAEYVLAGYGTGAIMAVPCGDPRDFGFAKHFNIPITNIIGSYFNGEEANATKDAILENSGFLNGKVMKEAMGIAIDKIEEMGIGKRKVNYRMRDAGFSRQRYWGEPFPIIWSDGIAIPLEAEELPLILPVVEKYGPGPEGEGPLANITDWVNLPEGGRRETSTMPGYAGSSWYFLRYMDPHNNDAFCDKKASDYWGQVDLYIGGTEHAVGHLLYSRLWTKILFDLGYVGHDEPFKKLVNQGMITGNSRFVFGINLKNIGSNYRGRIFISKTHYENLLAIQYDVEKSVKYIQKYFSEFQYELRPDSEFNVSKHHVHVDMVDGVDLDINKFIKWMGSEQIHFIYEDDGKYVCGSEVEKMSKSKFNVVNPDVLVEKYGADTFRMYEMFLGPVEQSKPWDTKGIEGVHRFLRKLWRLFNDDVKGKVWTDEKATDAELKIVHRTIKKIEEDTERFSFNTAVSTFMICVNELADAKCNKKEVLQEVLILLTPYAPHIAEELWHQLGNAGNIIDAAYPKFDGKYLIESDKEYPISINGKMRTNINISLAATQEEVEKIVLANELIQKWTEGKPPKKIIFVKGKMVNIVV